jgi:hypothetical protein
MKFTECSPALNFFLIALIKLIELLKFYEIHFHSFFNVVKRLGNEEILVHVSCCFFVGAVEVSKYPLIARLLPQRIIMRLS